MSGKGITHIFDLDGTLADSNPAWRMINKDIVMKYGKTVSDDELDKMSAMGYADLFNALRGHGIDYGSVEQLQSEIDAEALRCYRDSIPLKDGAEGFVRSAASTGRTVLYTSSPSILVIPLLRRCGIYDMFDIYISAGEKGLDKYIADDYLKLCDMLGTEPRACRFYDDSPACLKAARNAGIHTIAVYDASQHVSDEEYMSISDEYIKDLKEGYWNEA